MSKEKHTPGPWVAHEDEESMATSVVMNEFGDILCVVGTYMTSTEDDFANANLIAAAPDLLAALKAVVSVADRATVEFDMAREAISKATGE